MPNPCRRRPRHPGYTMLELLVAIAIVAVLGAIAAPPLGRAVGRHAVVAELDGLEQAFHRARQAASRRGRDVVICASPDGDRCAGDWSHGWMAFVNDDGDGPPHRDAGEQRLEYRLPAERIRLTSNRTAFRIRADWRRSTNGTLAACARAGAVAGEPRGLVISYTGRPRRVSGAALLTHVSCP